MNLTARSCTCPKIIAIVAEDGCVVCDPLLLNNEALADLS